MILFWFLLSELVFSKQAIGNQSKNKKVLESSTLKGTTGTYDNFHKDPDSEFIDNSPTPIPFDYSQNTFENLNTTVIINESYEYDAINNSQFTDPVLPKEQDYLFVVQKEFTFENVQFSFSSASNKIGAIKIDSSEPVVIRNCVFNGCSTINGNAISITRHKSKIKIKEEDNEDTDNIIEDNQFITQ